MLNTNSVEPKGKAAAVATLTVAALTVTTLAIANPIIAAVGCTRPLSSMRAPD